MWRVHETVLYIVLMFTDTCKRVFKKNGCLWKDGMLSIAFESTWRVPESGRTSDVRFSKPKWVSQVALVRKQST